MILYLAGPMTGLPDNNYPAFHAAAAALRAAGHTVLSPAENPPPPEGYTGNVWQYYMRLSLKQIADSEGVAILHGWASSKGATVEQELAVDLGIPLYYQVHGRPGPNFEGPRGEDLV